MAATTGTACLLFLVLLFPAVLSLPSASSPYLSPTTIFQNYQNMLTNFKIFIYDRPFDANESPAASIFYNSLIRSRFLTDDPSQADLFFVPFSAGTSPRALSRLIRNLRNTYPYWNRTLGADHFFLSPAGIDYSSDRNVLELKKNSVQISLFPVVSGLFIPHKDITLPPLNLRDTQLFHGPIDSENSTSFLAYLRWDETTEPNLANELKGCSDFLVEEKSSPRLSNYDGTLSKFCLFLYHGEVTGLVDAMARGCVPVIIVDRPVQDLPLMDVLRWSDLSLLVAAPSSGGGADRLKEVLNGVSEEKYESMRELGMAASKHLVWNEEQPQPLDAFHMVMYQLWLRRHVIRYARRELIDS